MSRSSIARLGAGLTALSLTAALAQPPDGNPLVTVPVERFATLPDGVAHPEGIAANPLTRDVFVGTFNFASENFVLRLARDGHVTAQKSFGASPLLGLEYRAGKVYILNFSDPGSGGQGSLQRIDAGFDAGSAVETVAVMPTVGAPPDRFAQNPDGSQDQTIFGSTGHAAPNAMAFDQAGNLYISDSFQGAIFRVPNATACAAPCAVDVVSHDTLLATAGFPPFGANGLAFNADESKLYVANTGDNRVLALDMATQTLGVLAESLHGADGLLFHDGLLWVATNQADRLVALNADGRIVARAGDFLGIRRDGTPEGLLFPASMAVVGDTMYVTNLALALTGSAAEPEGDVTRWTVSRLHLPR